MALPEATCSFDVSLGAAMVSCAMTFCVMKGPVKAKNRLMIERRIFTRVDSIELRVLVEQWLVEKPPHFMSMGEDGAICRCHQDT